MDNSGYVIDGNRAAKLISSNIYNPVSWIVEEVANYYDVDATEVRINIKEQEDIDGKVYINEIVVTGDGEGLSLSALNNLREIGNSKKRNQMYTNKFIRAKLGSFGIAFTSFQNLADKIEIYSKPNPGTILYKKITIKNDLAMFTDTKSLIECNLIGYETGCAFIIKNCKILKSGFFNLKLLKNKLAYLPVSENFKIYLNEEEIRRFIVNDDKFYNLTSSFNIGDVKFESKVYYVPNVIDNEYFRGVYLQIDERIIDWNIFNDIRQKISTPGAVETRIQGYIVANELRDKINAGRTGLTDASLSLSISEVLKKNIGTIHNKAKKYYEWEKPSEKKSKKGKNNSNEIININQFTKGEKSLEVASFDRNVITIEEKETYNKSGRKEKAEKRIKNINSDLRRLGIKFCYEPECEIEVIIIVSEMCQKGLLDFKIIQAISNEYPDSIIIKDGKQAFLEFEQSLNNFYNQEHNHNGVDYILCWDINKKTIDKNLVRYLTKYSRYLKSVQLREIVDDIYCDELIFSNYDGTQHIVKLYILCEIIKKL